MTSQSSHNDFEANRLPGYYNSAYPCEAGGPRRQKAPRSRGIGLLPDETLAQTSRMTGKWNVMILQRGAGEIYLLGNSNVPTPNGHGFVEKIDPVTLEAIQTSPPLDCGGHNWCGGLGIHENGDMYAGVGNYIHRLDANCQVVRSVRLPHDRAYNGVMFLADGQLITKNMEMETGTPSTFSVLDADTLEFTVPDVSIPEPSMGRFAIDLHEDEQHIYVPGITTIYRYIYKNGSLTRDADWTYRYRGADDAETSFSWDVVLSSGYVWLQTNGGSESQISLLSSTPVGTIKPRRGTSWKGLGSGAVRVHKISMADSSDACHFTPFGLANGNVISPPTHDPITGAIICFDSSNGQLGAFRFRDSAHIEELWTHAMGATMQFCLFPDTGEIAINDFRDGADNIVILDIETGAEKGRAATDSPFAHGMILSAGQNRDLYYCSTGFISRIFVKP